MQRGLPLSQPPPRSSVIGAVLSREFRPTLKTTLVTLCIWLAVNLCAATFLQLAGWRRLIAGSVVECTLLSGVVLLLVSWRSLQWALGALPSWQKQLLMILAFLSLCAQELKVRAVTYPFVDWRMYSDKVETATVRLLQYEGLLQDGRRISLAPAELVPTLNHRRLYGKLEDLERASRRAHDDAAGQAEELFEQALRSAAGIYNGRHDADPLLAIEVFQTMVHLNSFHSAAPLERRLVRRVTLAREGS